MHRIIIRADAKAVSRKTMLANLIGRFEFESFLLLINIMDILMAQWFLIPC
jgi:hypothetical protein